ncbi:MAG TPA: hypothetical protein VF476_07835 [Chitinophagaceae bacterium]
MDRFPKAISIHGRLKTHDVFLEKVIIKTKEELESLRNIHYKLDHVLKEEKLKWSDYDGNFFEKVYRLTPKWVVVFVTWALSLLGIKELRDILSAI